MNPGSVHISSGIPLPNHEKQGTQQFLDQHCSSDPFSTIFAHAIVTLIDLFAGHNQASSWSVPGPSDLAAVGLDLLSCRPLHANLSTYSLACQWTASPIHPTQHKIETVQSRAAQRPRKASSSRFQSLPTSPEGDRRFHRSHLPHDYNQGVAWECKKNGARCFE